MNYTTPSWLRCFYWLCLCASLGSACSAVIDTDKRKLGAIPVACEPGTRAQCPCSDGTLSTQLCNTLARYDSCACGVAAGSGGAAGASGRTGATAGRAGR